MKRLCFVSPFAYGLFYPESKEAIGGAEVQLYQIAKACATREGYDVSLVLADFGQEEEQREGVSLLRAFRAKPRGWSRCIAIIRAPFLLWSALARADADVYIQRAAGAETGITGLYCRLHKKRFVYMVAHERECTGEYATQAGLRGRLFRFGLHRADRVLAQHKGQCSLLREHEGIQAELFPTVFPDISAGLPPSKRTEVLWIGRLLAWKRPEVVISLARRFPHVPFTVIAQGDDAYAREIRQQFDQLPNVQHLKLVPFSQIGTFFANARLFLNTSTFEGFPNTFIQAAQHGTPILSLKVDPEGFLKREGCGLSTNDDVKKLGDHLENILNDGLFCDQMSMRARSYFAREHELSAHVTQFLHLLYEPT